jgi:hypothetical protein
MNPKKAHQPEIEMWENLKEQLAMVYTQVIIKIRFENHAVILHFPHLNYEMTFNEYYRDKYKFNS